MREKFIGRITKHKDNTIDVWFFYESQEISEKELPLDPSVVGDTDQASNQDYWPFYILKEISRLTSGS